MLKLLKSYRIRKRLKASLRPDPEFLERRLAQFSTERRAKHFENIRKAGL
jgi:hypothetical protein